MSTLLELTAQIVSAHQFIKTMTLDKLIQEIQDVHASLKFIDSGLIIETKMSKQLTIKQAFKKNEVICMICGKGGFKTLKRHLTQGHDLTPGQYRKQFNIPTSMPLTARSYSESRKQMAIDKGLGDGLAKARSLRAASGGKKAGVSALKVIAPVPAVKVKAGVPAVKAKSAVPMKSPKK
ncbi:MAG: MucR family transcriptional regulator [Legionella sp.]|uniref:MucR family transcriptional regulator n=1 Tax=Legionella sp. TaxID=459 RepID=UPI00284B4153|nr:MucR family transcriptional regulator [Legionella sp.]